MAVIQALQNAGYDPEFFDIDGLRPSFDDVINHFRDTAPDVVAISAVVSTAYSYTKKLCLALREVLPHTKTVLGGNLAASAELLHRFGGVNVCVIGEGERIAVNLLNYFQRNPAQPNYSELEKIKGITFINASGEMVFTGYETALPPAELMDPDYSILERYSRIENFVVDPLLRNDFQRDPRSRQPHRAGKKKATVVSAKGCVARCTFCHRWDRGFRQVPPEHVIRRIQYLIDRYNVGFIHFGDENFGSDRKATEEIIRLIKPLDVLWVVAGVRARSVDPDLLTRMYDAGCSGVYYGFETGSPDMLKVMEKNLELHHNFDAARWTHDAGLHTCYQIVLAMPGETSQTVNETTRMLQEITDFLPEPPYNYLSVNYIQALPGTPVYEYARTAGLIGGGLEGEEKYLERVSDIDAMDDTKFLNFTKYPYLVVRSWRTRMLYEVTAHWYRRHHESKSRSIAAGQSYDDGGYFNLHELKVNPLLLRLVYPIRSIPIWLQTLVSELQNSGLKVFSARLVELLVWLVRRPKEDGEYRSLRTTMKDLADKPTRPSEESMMPLRLGR
jgi:radical SAM superfamily enzyme YgiQ (UPF0313 family)